MFDYVAALDPMVNNEIHFFQIPQYFKLFRVHGKCCMQYAFLTGGR